MSFKAFIGESIVSQGNRTMGQALLVEAGLIKGMCHASAIPAGAETIKLAGLTLAAGLVDAQVNGGGGILFNDNISANGIDGIAKAHREAGTTSFLPTLISDTPEKTTIAINTIREYGQKNGVMGIHLEGPFLNPERSGIHEKDIIAKANTSFLHSQKFSGLGVCLITVAPEIFQKGELKKLRDAGAILAAGHSAANKDQLAQAKNEGLTGITHLFNAMGGMSARETGLSGAALNDDELWCGIIADGAHVAPDMLRLADKAKPNGKLFLVSDAMPPSGQHPQQPFALQGKYIRAENGKCVDERGALAGSAFTLFECVRYAVQQAGFKLEHALAMASYFPAQFLGIEKTVGSFVVGARADIIAFDDGMNLKHVFIGGNAA
ncbi:MAG: N-acetylglucosamine-6-phosphate deacetylase [Alphaproteobacteria bacterium]|nr:N-acetylglucosamine-6-phosphate deacetylase [Alphaproteobacteria bacterium]